MKYLLITLLIFFFCCTCKSVKSFRDDPLPFVGTRYLAHRGGANSAMPDNSLAAVRFGLQHGDGIECDIMLSKDRTIWLSHDAELRNCGDLKFTCFAETSDAQIEQINTCLGTLNAYVKLETVMQLMRDSFPGKFIDLDCKTWKPCALSSLNVAEAMLIEAAEICRLSEKYNLKGVVFAESEFTYFLNEFVDRNCGVGAYLQSSSDWKSSASRALQAKYQGVVFKMYDRIELSRADVELMRRKGLRVQVYNAYTLERMKAMEALRVDFIQADTLPSTLGTP